MVIDLTKCTACQACVVACQSENNVPLVPPEEAQRGRILSWINVLPELEGEYPQLKMRLPEELGTRPKVIYLAEGEWSGGEEEQANG